MMSRRLQLIATAVFVLAFGIPPVIHASALPVREGPRPVTTDDVPHVQIGVEPVPELTAELLRLTSELEFVDVRNTVISLPGAKGFWLDEELELAHPEAIVGGREFAHVHPDGSLHAALSPEMAEIAVQAGWATPHPWADQRPGWEGFVMIYTPGTAKELEVVFELVKASYSFITGKAAQ